MQKNVAINYVFYFRVETIDGSAVEGEDYEPVNEILTFEPREREKEVKIFFRILIFGIFYSILIIKV